jgi:hypothetical protein
MTGLKASVPIGLKETSVMVQPEHTDARFGVYWVQYFPYSVDLKMKEGNIEASFKDAYGKEVQNPPFLRYQWKKDRIVLENEKSKSLTKPSNAIYEFKVIDDNNLHKTIKVKLADGRIVEG